MSDDSTTAAAAEPPLPDDVLTLLQRHGHGRVIAMDTLAGGLISLARRLHTDLAGDRQAVVVKQCISHAMPPRLYELEAAGLEALCRAPGGPRVPRVLGVSETWIALEDVGRPMELCQPTDAAWDAFGHAVAAMHSCTAPQFGFHHDNYLGVITQNNAWTDDGVAQWVDRRVLHYLESPLFQQHTTADDRRALERYAAFARRALPPAQRPALLHGDLYYANVLATPDNAELLLIDPAVYYGLAESEISLTQQWGHFPARFYDAYAEHDLLADGWRDRLEIYYIAQLAGMIAHVGDQWNLVAEMREHLARYVTV